MKMIALISERTLKGYTVVNDNVDACYIYPSIYKAQDMGLQPLIGSVLYRLLLEKVEDGSIYQDERLSVLMDEYIAPYLCNKATAELQWALFAKIRNNGIVTSQDQQMQQLSIADCEYTRKKYEYDADFYGKRLTDFLRANSSTYPEWMQRENCADIKADPKAYKTCITL